AVSYQIKILEERVGAPLFVRQARGVTLTDVGRKFAHRATEAMDILSDGFSEAKGLSQETLSVSVIPTFGTNFLAQHLGAFQMANPDIAVRLEVNEGIVDFTDGVIDVAIRGGEGNWPGLRSYLIMPIHFTPILSSELAESIGGVHVPKDLLKLPILSPADPWWLSWCQAAGLETPDLDGRPYLRMGPQILEANAAIAGQGIAMLTPAFFKQELSSGRLIQPFELTCDDGFAYWLVFPDRHRHSQKIRKFQNWLQEVTKDFRT
ncbi:MAG: LysR substrate-binding domain-containing protein, partial [Pseudomonadota bacterium]